MAKWRKILGGITGIGIVVLFWSIAYWLVNLLFPILGIVTNEYVKDLLVGVLGFLLMISTIYLIGKIFRSHRDDVFHVIVDAIKQISKGNFKVKLNLDRVNSGHPFATIATSINNMAEELNEMETMRQAFISNVSHEIQSPLTSIRGFARALQNASLSESQQAHYVDIIITESIRLSKLSDNLMKLTSLESDHHPFTPKTYRLDKQIKQVILVHEPQWLSKNITIDPILSPVEIQADEDLLNQVWSNLLHNSIKFTNDAGTITVTLSQEKDHTVIQFKDTGSGISSTDQLHIFERFYKGDKSRSRNGAGSGLGLSIVKKIVDLHQGTIRVKSQVGKGTEIVISIPSRHNKR
jgi:signal transduction histidine kinase